MEKLITKADIHGIIKSFNADTFKEKYGKDIDEVVAERFSVINKGITQTLHESTHRVEGSILNVWDGFGEYKRLLYDKLTDKIKEAGWNVSRGRSTNCFYLS